MLYFLSMYDPLVRSWEACLVENTQLGISIESMKAKSTDEIIFDIDEKSKLINCDNVADSVIGFIATAYILLEEMRFSKTSSPQIGMVMLYFKFLDLALIAGGPNDDVLSIISNSKILADTLYNSRQKHPSTFFVTTQPPCLPDTTTSLPTLYNPTFSEFDSRSQAPLILQGLISMWPSLSKWKCPQFWQKLAGHRWFPVEFGSSYQDEKWRQDYVMLNDYLSDFVFNLNPTNIGYIAQHNWAFQLPVLRDDFSVPDICLLASSGNVLTNFWYGMKDCFSPLHFDEYDNFFCQVVGYKEILLIQDIGREVSSNSLNIECSELERLVENTAHSRFIVGPGDVIFIPKGCWHQVRSVTFSISISFWY